MQHYLHTIVIGLSGVENGLAVKPDDLDISWKAHDVVGSAREARRFVLRATLILVAEELKEYATRVLKYLTHGTQALPETREDRIKALSAFSPVDPSYLILAPLIVSHWRNRIIHRKSTASLTAEEKHLLLTQNVTLRDNYKGIDVSRLLEDFHNNQPTLKDVTVLLAMSIKFVRQVDARLTPPSTSEEIRRWLQAEDLLANVLKLEKEAANGGHPDPRHRAKQYLLTEAPSLAQGYYVHGAGLA
ncbi:MAG: hypothetical protein ACJ71U_21280 [Terriglobales bacterium]